MRPSITPKKLLGILYILRTFNKKHLVIKHFSKLQYVVYSNQFSKIFVKNEPVWNNYLVLFNVVIRSVSFTTVSHNKFIIRSVKMLFNHISVLQNIKIQGCFLSFLSKLRYFEIEYRLPCIYKNILVYRLLLQC